MNTVGRCSRCGAESAAGSAATSTQCPACLLELALEPPQSLALEQLGPYEILSRLGMGGMGVVYRARDSRLGREVAIKVLPDAVANDPERISRFRREARVAASLNHPNIAAVYGFEDEGGAHFLVMELVEGPTLAERLRGGPLPIDEALAIVEQIAGGLEAAHDNGIVHRDLKPANVKITPDGKAKILDFGLAKPANEPAPAADIELSPTITAQHTTPGMVLGTIPYMSPEQARGRAVDKRSDIWSLGCVLYECLVGRRAFDGDTATDVLAKILERDPDWDALPARTPPRVRELLERCLEKDLKHRVRDSGDVRIELERARDAREWSTSGLRRIRRPRRARIQQVLPWAVAGVLAVALAASLVTRRGTTSSGGRAPRAPLRADVSDPEFPRVPYEDAATLAISPDGMTIAYIGPSPTDPKTIPEAVGLYVRRADETRAHRVESPCDKPIYDPFFSPDGKWLGCSCAGIYKIPLSGGPPVQLAESTSFSKGASWSTRGIVFAPAAKSGLVLVKEEGGPLETLTVPDASKGEVSHRWPSVLPDARHVLFTIKKEGITSFDQADIALLDVEKGTWKTLIHGGSFAKYLPSGQIVFARGDAILAVPFDLRAGSVTGEPVSVASGVMTEPSSGAAQYAIAQDAGTLAFVPGGARAARIELDWIDRTGRSSPIGAPLLPWFNPVLSPDGTRVASTIWGATDTVVVYDVARRSLTRLPIEGNCTFVDWTPDSRQVLYVSDIEGRSKYSMFLARADGSGRPQLVLADVLPSMLSRIVRLEGGIGVLHGDKDGIVLNAFQGDRSPRRFSRDLPTGFFDQSPDARWLVFDSESSGQSEIYITSFPSGGGAWQITRGGGYTPIWSPHGDEVTYWRGSGSDVWLRSVRVSTANDQVSSSAPTDLFKIPADIDMIRPDPDGRRFLAMRTLPPQFKGDRILVVLNWFDQVQARTSAR